jgi:hypothetical protein
MERQDVPWTGRATPYSVFAACWPLGMLGLSGVVYAVVVIRRLRVQTAYQLLFKDWLFRGMLPFFAYATLAVSAFAIHSNRYEAIFGTAAAALLLLFNGIHNAWEAATYHVFLKKRDVE